MKKEDYNNLLKEDYAKLMAGLDASSSKMYSDSYKDEQNSKTKCPFCGGNDVAEKIRNVNGDFEADADATGGLFFSSSRASVSGSIQTDPVMWCKSCKNEWKPNKSEYRGDGDVLRDYLFDFYRWYDDAGEVSFNSEDPSETYKSREEKQAAFDQRLENYRYTENSKWIIQFYPSTIRWALKKTWGEYDFYDKIGDWDNKVFYLFGFKEEPEIDRIPSWFETWWGKIFK